MYEPPIFSDCDLVQITSIPYIADFHPCCKDYNMHNTVSY